MRKILLVVALISLIFSGLGVAQAYEFKCSCSNPTDTAHINGVWDYFNLEYPSCKGLFVLTVSDYACGTGVVEIILSTKDIAEGANWGTLDSPVDRIIKKIGMGTCDSVVDNTVFYDSQEPSMPIGTYYFDVLVPLWGYTPGSGARMYAVYNQHWDATRYVIARTDTF